VAPLTECPGASLDRLQRWLAHAFVSGAAQGTSLLVQQGGRYVAKARLTGGGSNYSEVVVHLGNQAGAAVDLSKVPGFTITYSSTADLWIELRGTVLLHGGDQWAVKLPSSGGQMTTKDISLEAAAWGRIFGPPPVAFAEVLKTASMFDIVGNAANDVTFAGLRFDGYVPQCR
jgi:hypothetical protein